MSAVLEVLPFHDNKVKLKDGQVHLMANLIHPSELYINLRDESLVITYRLYFNEPDLEKEETLSDKQKAILNCIYLRHYNGYIRERRLQGLIPTSEYWVIPFTTQLLGEYVYELLEGIDRHVNEQNIDLYQEFILENPNYWQKTASRMISYWNEYYRKRFLMLKQYLGYEIVQRIKKRKHNV
ncbi:hypothetical protein [Pontibacter russatus]|uniref:hypothetical protein n=1 Tax=Pontibacter russatus TaxID=2694929 RepID=UPI00137A8381|nr:hypothetical protein [Pontibacter russatus]